MTFSHRPFPAVAGARALRVAIAIAAVLLLGACASAVREAEQLNQQGRFEQAFHVLQDARQRDPDDGATRTAWLRQRELTLTGLASRADVARSAQRYDEMAQLLARMEAIDPNHPRVAGLRAEVARQQRIASGLQAARDAQRAGRGDAAREALRKVLDESPGHPVARRMIAALNQQRRPAPLPTALGEAYQKPVTLEFREAPLRSVLEGLSRATGVNFVFDRDVRADAKVTIYLKDVTVDEALRVILATQQLDRKLLNERTVMVYPGTQGKQREHQELETRSFYLTNADVKQAQALVRTVAKTRDLYVDERLNLLVARDTPEVLAIVERLLATLDLAEPEVVLEVEVVEIASGRLDELGLSWPQDVQFGLLATDAATGNKRLADSLLTRADLPNLRVSIANPAIGATLRETLSRGNILANPRLRARNHEKAKVVVGEKLPVFTTTTTPSGGSTPTIAAMVTYLDIGLKLEVEPSVQLDNDVIMKVNLEVSTLIGKVLGPQGSVAYQVGTRQAATSLRLRDGETQVLAGLIRQEDTKAVNGVPGLAGLPLLGRLFGVHSDQTTKTEVVLLITPRVVRNIDVPDADLLRMPGGNEANPGAESVRLSARAAPQVPMAGAGAGPAAAPVGAAAGGAPAPGPTRAVLHVSLSGQMSAGDSGAVTLRNASGQPVQGRLRYDPSLLQPAQAGGNALPGEMPFALMAGGEQVTMLRALPGAAGRHAGVSVELDAGGGPDVEVEYEGEPGFQVLAR